MVTFGIVWDMTSKERIDKALHILGISTPVEDTEVFRTEVIRAFRAAAKRDHPDKNRGDPTAKNRFVEAKEAKDLLLRASRGVPLDDGPSAEGPADSEGDPQAGFEEDVISMLETLADELKNTQISLGKLRLEVKTYRNQTTLMGQEIEALRAEILSLKRALKAKAHTAGPGQFASTSPRGHATGVGSFVGFSPGPRSNQPADDSFDSRLSWDPEEETPDSPSDFIDDVTRVVRSVFGGRGNRRRSG